MELTKLAKEWLDSAESDYQYAAIGLESNEVYPQVAFLSQQVAEKSLKAFLLASNLETPRIHDLPKLLDSCVSVNPNLESVRDECELLTGFYIETRYPPDIPDYAKSDIEKAFQSAKKVKELVSHLLR